MARGSPGLSVWHQVDVIDIKIAHTWSESGLVVAATDAAAAASAPPPPTPTVQLLRMLSARQGSKLDGRFLFTKSTGRL